MGELLRRRVRVTFDIDVVVNDLSPEELSDLTKRDGEDDEDNWRVEWVQRQMQLLDSVLADEEATDTLVTGQAMQAVFFFADEGLDIEADEVQDEVLVAHAKKLGAEAAGFFVRVKEAQIFHENTTVLRDRFHAEVVSDSWTILPKAVEAPVPLEVQPEPRQPNRKARRAELQKPKKKRR